MSAASNYVEELGKMRTERNQALRAEECAIEEVAQLQLKMAEIYNLVAAVMTRGTVGQQDYKDLKAAKEIARKSKSEGGK